MWLVKLLLHFIFLPIALCLGILRYIHRRFTYVPPAQVHFTGLSTRNTFAQCSILTQSPARREAKNSDSGRRHCWLWCCLCAEEKWSCCSTLRGKGRFGRKCKDLHLECAGWACHWYAFCLSFVLTSFSELISDE